MRLEYFELVDRIEELRLEEGFIRARGIVPAESPIFEGHFPSHPLMPGVLLIEVMAQTVGWLTLARLKFKQMGFLAAVREAKLRNFVGPGADLVIEGTLEHEGSGYAIASAKVLNESKPIADADLTLRILPFSSTEFAEAVHKRAGELGLTVGA